MLAAIEELEGFVNEQTFEGFLEDRMLQAAVERKLEVIGEALNRLKLIKPVLLDQIRDATNIIGMRNIIAHGYDVIDLDIVWDVVDQHLPALKSDAIGLLADLDSD